jgi:uncharacterized protein (TIGR04255 family)
MAQFFRACCFLLSDPHAIHSELELVTFERPPLSEVGLSVQFARPDVVDLDVLAAFTAATREHLPQREHHPPMPPIVETFNDTPRPMSFNIQFQGQLTLPRTWFISDDQVHLVQLQPDRLSFNWRRIDEIAYPRYSDIRQHLMHYLDLLYRCVREAGGADPTVNLCEVAYINPIKIAGSAPNEHPDLGRVLRRVRDERSLFLPEPEDTQLQERFRIPGESGPIGRLYLAATPAVAGAPPEPVYMVNLAARVLVTGHEVAHVCQALDLGHEWVVRGFRDATTEETHALWGLREEDQ